MARTPQAAPTGRRRLARVSVWLTVLLGAWLPLDQAHAHALVVASQPKVNSSIDGRDVAIDLQFNSRLDRQRARLRLIPAEGEARELEILAGDDPAHLRTRAGALAPGDYRIEWYVLSPDGHVTRGNVPFKVQTP